MSDQAGDGFRGRLFDVRSLITPPRYDNEVAVRGLCTNAYLGDDTSLCRVLGRYKMFVDTKDIGLSSHLLMDGYWEMWTTEAMLFFIKPGDVAVDVGANLGYFTLLMADLVGPTGVVHAFEPNPPIAERLQQSVSINGFGGNTTVHAVALADRDGETGFMVPKGEPKNAHLVDRSDDAALVAVRRLDGMGLSPDFMKIDCEGAEELVWKGMAGILAQRRPMTIFMEFAPIRYDDPARFVDEILRHGFALAIVDPERGVQPISRAEVLAGAASVDQMLVLRR